MNYSQRFRPLVIALVLLFGSAVHAQSNNTDSSDEKKNDIRILLDLMEVGPTMRQVLIDQIEIERAQGVSGVPDKFWDEFKEEAIRAMPDLIEKMIPIYDDLFTHDEIQVLVKIHRDPVMMKYSKLGEQIASAGMKIGEAWGEDLGRRIGERLLQEEERNLEEKEG